MGAFTTWPSWPGSGSATNGAAGAAGAGRASAGAGAVPEPGVAADAGAMLTAPPLTIFTFSSPSVISSSAMPDSCTRSISFFSLRRSIASSPPGGYSALGTCGGLQWIFWIFAGEGCILAQQPFENLLHLRSGKRAEPAMIDRTHPVNHDSIGQSAKGVSQPAHQLNRMRPGYQHGVGDAVGLCKFRDFSCLIDADTDNFRTFRGKDLPDGNQHRDLFAARTTPGCPEVAHYDAAPPLPQGSSRSAAPLCTCSASAPTSPPATAAPAPIAPRIRTSRLASAIAQERPDLRDSGAVHHAAGLRGLQRKPLVARIEYRQLERCTPPQQRQHADRVRSVPREAPAFMRGVRDVTVQQKQLHVLGAFGEQLQFDLSVASCNPLQDWTGQVWFEALQRAHRVERHAAQFRDA